MVHLHDRSKTDVPVCLSVMTSSCRKTGPVITALITLALQRLLLLSDKQISITLTSTSSSIFTLRRHVGHRPLAARHDVMHALQNRCPHGKTVSLTIGSKQMTHSLSSQLASACRPARDSKYDTAELCCRNWASACDNDTFRRSIRSEMPFLNTTQHTVTISTKIPSIT